jgi:arsenate reductase (glutaredoxin)
VLVRYPSPGTFVTTTRFLLVSAAMKSKLPTGFTIYHNPKCTKSRGTLALLQENAVEPRIIEYLKTPPTALELKAIIGKLGIAAEDLVRKGEEVYKANYAGKQLTAAQWIEAMVSHPILIERPIVVSGNRAVIGRPPENVKSLLGK